VRKKSYLTITDQFCGAGGSSQGARAVSRKYKGGIELTLALNHWKLAIETHSTNFPQTRHDCTDVSAADPRWYPSTDILITSPECTNHSLAKGKKYVRQQIEMYEKGTLDPSAERSRATMWDVPRFAEYHKYNLIIVENVVDARKWINWDAWLKAMIDQGYDYKCCYFNAMHFHPVPQSRDRLYVVFWKKKNKAPDLNFNPRAYCPACGKDIEAVQRWKKPDFKWGRYRRQYVYTCPIHGEIVEPYYYAAFNAIDWSDLGIRIGDRDKPLAPNTIERIKYGLKKYGREPLIVTGRYTSGVGCRVRAVTKDSLPTQPGDQSHYLFSPAVLIKNYAGRFKEKYSAVDIRDAFHTITTVDHHALLSTPFIVKAEHSSHINVRGIKEPFQTQTTRQSMGLVVPFIIDMNRTGKARSIDESLATITAGGIKNGIITHESWNAFINYYYNSPQSSHMLESFDTIPTKDRMHLVHYKTPKIEDCYYRMLKPPEIHIGMGFDDGYIVLGSNKDKVKQYGNAVCPPKMEWLLERVIESLN